MNATDSDTIHQNDATDAPETTLALPNGSPSNGSSRAESTHQDAVEDSTNRSKGGAPHGNQNRMRHGLRASQLPKKAKAEEFAIYAFRRELLAALAIARGTSVTSFADELVVNRATRHETQARLAARYLRVEANTTLADRLKLLDVIATATEARDKAIRQLGIIPDGKSTDPWTEFDQDRQRESFPNDQSGESTPEAEQSLPLTQP